MQRVLPFVPNTLSTNYGYHTQRSGWMLPASQISFWTSYIVLFDVSWRFLTRKYCKTLWECIPIAIWSGIEFLGCLFLYEPESPETAFPWWGIGISLLAANLIFFFLFWGLGKCLDARDIRKNFIDRCKVSCRKCCGGFWKKFGLKLWSIRHKQEFGYGGSWMFGDTFSWVFRIFFLVCVLINLTIVLLNFHWRGSKIVQFQKLDQYIVQAEIIIFAITGILLNVSAFKGKKFRDVLVTVYRLALIMAFTNLIGNLFYVNGASN